MPDTNPTPVDLDAIEAKWLHVCGSCDAGLNYDCTCPSDDPRSIIQILVDELRARSARAAIPGPDSRDAEQIIALSPAADGQMLLDSERIRELEAECGRLRGELERTRTILYGSDLGGSRG
jgi:hypothetical protein